MKNLLTLLFGLLFFSTSFAQKSEFDISTLRMGPYKIFMPKEEAEAIAGQKLVLPSEANDYYYINKVTYEGYAINLIIMDIGDEQYVVSTLTTSNPKFKTKSGIGVGSTRHQLIETYKDFSSFSHYPEWDVDRDGYSKTNYYFIINDLEAGTSINFKLVNNRVAEITVSMALDGC